MTKHPVEKLMKKFKTSQKGLADLLSVDKATLWRWKDSKKDIPARHHSVLLRLAKNREIKLPKTIFYV